MNRDFNTLLIPVESQARELDGKILLACIAAEKGFKAIIGSRAYIHFYASKVQRGIYLAKSMRRFSHTMFKILNHLGHRIVAWDEESLVRLPDRQYYLHRLCPDTFSYIDHLFAWGTSDAQVFKHYPAYNRQPVHSVGNPRIDIIRPELRDYFLPEKNQLINQYGNYILVNTNFGQVNHFIPEAGESEASRDKNLSQQSQDDFIARRYAHKKALFTHFKNLLPLLAATFPDTNFILRPHPSENLHHWQAHLKNYKNLFVTNRGNASAWISGAQALISNGCTTAIEATVLNTPSLGYYPVTCPGIDDALPKALSDVCRTDHQLCRRIDQVIAGQYTGPDNDRQILSAHIANLDGAFAADKIIDTIDLNYTQTQHRHNPLSRIKGITRNNTRTIIKYLNSKKSSHRNSHQYHKHRFPAIDTDYIQHRIARLNHLTGRFANLNTACLSQHIFQLTV